MNTPNPSFTQASLDSTDQSLVLKKLEREREREWGIVIIVWCIVWVSWYEYRLQVMLYVIHLVESVAIINNLNCYSNWYYEQHAYIRFRLNIL